MARDLSLLLVAEPKRLSNANWGREGRREGGSGGGGEERKEEKEGMRGRRKGGRGHILAFTQAGKELAAKVDFRRYGKIFILTLRLAGDMASCGEGDWEGGERRSEGRRERGGREGGCRGRERVREVEVREDSAGRPWGVVSCQGSPQCRGRE